MPKNQPGTSEEAKSSDSLTVVAAPPNAIPKWCNKANFAVHDNKYVIITLAYFDAEKEGMLIERVAMDMKMLMSTREAIDRVMQDAQKNVEATSK